MSRYLPSASYVLRTALRFACAVFRRCGRPLGVSSRLQPFGPSPFCKHLHPQFAIVDLQLRTVPSSAARCFASADFASLCVLEASAASRPPISHRAAFSGPVFRGCALRFAGPVFRGFDGYGLFRALRAAFVRPAKNARNDVHAVISDLSLVLPILCQCSEREAGIGPPPFVKKRASHASGGRSLKTPGDCPARENMV